MYLLYIQFILRLTDYSIGDPYSSRNWKLSTGYTFPYILHDKARPIDIVSEILGSLILFCIFIVCSGVKDAPVDI